MTTIKTFLAVAFPIFWGLAQWRIQFVEKSRHEAGTQFLEKLDLLIGSVRDYRQPCFSRDERKGLQDKWEIVNQAYIDVNRALIQLKTAIPGKETQKLADLYRNLIEERIVRKLYGIHYVYLRSTDNEEHHPEWLEILYKAHPLNLSKYNTIVYEKFRPTNKKILSNPGTIYIYAQGRRCFYCFKEHIFNKEILEGRLNLQGENSDIDEVLNNFDETTKEIIAEQATADIFGQIINKYFSDIASQCRKDFFINSWLLPVWKQTRNVFISLCKKVFFCESSS